MRSFLLVAMLLGGMLYAHAQQKYWVFFTDKPTAVQQPCISGQTMHNRRMLGLQELQWTDLPVDGRYTGALAQAGIEVVCTSKWLNAVSAMLTDAQLADIRSYPFVKEVRALTATLQEDGIVKDGKPDPWRWAFEQVKAEAIVTRNLTAKGVKIGVIDGGFAGAEDNKYITSLIDKGQIKGMRDFVDCANTSLLRPKGPGTSKHGIYVLQMLAGHNAVENVQYGLATGAQYYLARTDDVNNEFRGEEDYWIRALEWLDSLGVRLVNSSLGYSHYFDNAAENYKPTDMNGRTSTIARAAQEAVEKRGMIIVSSVGNEGTDSAWQVITTPSDARAVISVGAADIDYWFKSSFSGVGPTYNNYLKPNISCPTADGTSFAAPFITGLIACLLEKQPNLTSQRAMDIIERSGHLYPYGNNFMGYGMPNADRMLTLLENPAHDFKRSEEIKVYGDSIVLDLDKYRDKPGDTLTFFFKKDKYIVDQQAISTKSTGKLRRKNNIERVTIASRSKVVEVIWMPKQNALPGISNMKAVLKNKKLQVTYDLSDPDDTKLNVKLLAIGPDGKILSPGPSALSGDVGWVSTGTGKSIVWQTSISDATNYKVRVVADDGHKVDIAALLEQVATGNLTTDLAMLAQHRHHKENKAQLEIIKNKIAEDFTRKELSAERQEFLYEGYKAHNIIGTIKGIGHDSKVFVLGAHFDAVKNSPGADDNASGIAGMLEAMRVLSKYQFQHSISFVGFDLEEIDLQGSKKFVSGLRPGQLIGMMNLDMIGFYSTESNSQVFPGALKGIFPDAYRQVSENNFKGDFILNTSNESSAAIARQFDSCAKAYVPGLHVVSLVVPDDGRFAPQAFRSSDHVPFWDAGLNAISIGDTGDTRNVNYHSKEDILATVNINFMRQVVKAVVATVATAAGITHATVSEINIAAQ